MLISLRRFEPLLMLHDIYDLPFVIISFHDAFTFRDVIRHYFFTPPLPLLFRHYFIFRHCRRRRLPMLLDTRRALLISRHAATPLFAIERDAAIFAISIAMLVAR